MAKTSFEEQVGKKAESTHFAAQMAGKAEGSISLIFLSNIGGNLKNIFASQREVFQCTSFVLSAIGLGIAAVKLALAPNKNLGKTQNLAVAIAKFAIAGTLLFAAATLAPVAATALFFSLISVDTLIAGAKAIYFGIKALTSRSEEEKTFFKEKAKQNGIGAALGAITITGFAITMAIGHSIAAAAGVIGGVIAGSAVLISIGQAIHQTFFKKKKSETPQEKSEKENELEKVLDNDLKEKKEEGLEKGLTAKAASEPEQTQAKKPSSYALLEKVLSTFTTGYHDYRVTLPKNPEEIKVAINDHIEKIMNEVADDKEKANGSLWTQNEKRENKIHALGFLEELLKNSHNGIDKSGTIEITGYHSFEYENKEDLIKQIDQYVLKTYPDAYQSFFKDTGKVEDLFKQVYQVLRDAPEKPPVVTPPVAEENNTIAAQVETQSNSATELTR